jgi:hypothetical protein
LHSVQIFRFPHFFFITERIYYWCYTHTVYLSRGPRGTPRWPEKGVDQSWPELTRVDQSWPELTRVDQSWRELTRVDESWPELTRVDQSWPELTRVDQKKESSCLTNPWGSPKPRNLKCDRNWFEINAELFGRHVCNTVICFHTKYVELEEFIDNICPIILKNTHPSPLSRRTFVGNDHLKSCNDIFEINDKIKNMEVSNYV